MYFVSYHLKSETKNIFLLHYKNYQYYQNNKINKQNTILKTNNLQNKKKQTIRKYYIKIKNIDKNYP